MKSGGRLTLENAVLRVADRTRCHHDGWTAICEVHFKDAATLHNPFLGSYEIRAMLSRHFANGAQIYFLIRITWGVVDGDNVLQKPRQGALPV
jgi:hypothetical protein